jgi:hypothetical protein
VHNVNQIFLITSVQENMVLAIIVISNKYYSRLNAKALGPGAGKSAQDRGLTIKLAATDSPTGEGSTIGAPGLNDSVRNGKR